MNKDLTGRLSKSGVRTGTGRTGGQLPAWRGTVIVDGKRYHIAGWPGTNPYDGEDQIDLKLTPKD